MIKFYKDKKGEWRWKVTARNGNVLADSGEGYKRKSACVRGAKRTYIILATATTVAA